MGRRASLVPHAATRARVSDATRRRGETRGRAAIGGAKALQRPGTRRRHGAREDEMPSFGQNPVSNAYAAPTSGQIVFVCMLRLEAVKSAASPDDTITPSPTRSLALTPAQIGRASC